jgi:large subunit ribosomal protein L28
MSRKCELTGKGPSFGHNVSHSNKKTRKIWQPNLQVKRIYVPELDRYVRLRVSTRALRTLNKKGLNQFLRDEGLTLKDLV